MSSDTTRTDTTLRYHLLGVLCWLYPVGYPRICQMHNTWKAMLMFGPFCQFRQQVFLKIFRGPPGPSPSGC